MTELEKAAIEHFGPAYIKHNEGLALRDMKWAALWALERAAGIADAEIDNRKILNPKQEYAIACYSMACSRISGSIGELMREEKGEG